MNEENLINYYNKFNENKRLDRKHGKIEFTTTINFILKYIKNYENPKIIDIGAGTGKYSKYLANLNYDVTAIELVKHNLRIIEEEKKIKAFQGNATDLSRFNDDTFDFTLLFGPMYHLISFEEKLKALNEAKRITKKGGIIMVAYVMNDYAIVTHGFKEHMILNERKNITNDYHINSGETDLYSYSRIEDIDKLNNEANLKRLTIFSPDGPANYLRKYLNEMDDEEFNEFSNYVLSIAERKDLIGAGAHTVDVLKK